MKSNPGRFICSSAVITFKRSRRTNVLFCSLTSILAARPFDHRSANALLRNVLIAVRRKLFAYINQWRHSARPYAYRGPKRTLGKRAEMIDEANGILASPAKSQGGGDPRLLPRRIAADPPAPPGEEWPAARRCHPVRRSVASFSERQAFRPPFSFPQRGSLSFGTQCHAHNQASRDLVSYQC
jgi:hypothetical protein